MFSGGNLHNADCHGQLFWLDGRLFTGIRFDFPERNDNRYLHGDRHFQQHGKLFVQCYGG